VQIGTRWHDAEITAIDEWIGAQPDRPGRAEAIRRLVRASSQETGAEILAGLGHKQTQVQHH
jgi:hypothetical protein